MIIVIMIIVNSVCVYIYSVCMGARLAVCKCLQLLRGNLQHVFGHWIGLRPTRSY